jgi:hypothetical protein
MERGAFVPGTDAIGRIPTFPKDFAGWTGSAVEVSDEDQAPEGEGGSDDNLAF